MTVDSESLEGRLLIFLPVNHEHSDTGYLMRNNDALRFSA